MPLSKIKEGSVDLIENTGNGVLKLPRTKGSREALARNPS